MEDLIPLIAIVLIVITLVKISSISNRIDSIEKKIAELNKKLTNILVQPSDKKEIDNIEKPAEKPKEQSQPIVQPEISNPVEKVSPPVFATEKIMETPVVEKFIEEEKQPPAEIKKEEEKVVSEVPLEIPQIEEIHEVQPIYAPGAKKVKAEESVFSEILDATQKTNQQKEAPQEKNFVGKIFGENLLSKVGIITLVLGIGFFVKYAIDQDWINEIGRVGIGLLTGAIIIGIAHKLKSSYHVFSSILVGGGISVFYITITLAFREYELFGQTPAFIMLIGTTAFSVILSLLYNRKELAIFSLLGGFSSPLMVSTGTGNYIVLFSYILILNTGMLVVSFRKSWRVIGVLCYVLTLLFFWLWLFQSYNSELVGAIVFSTLFFLQFYLLAIIDHFRTEKKITSYQAMLILSDNLLFFASCFYIFRNYPYDVRGIITIAIALINAVILIVLFRNSKVDRKLIYLLIALVMSFVSLAVPIQLHGHAITMFWAAETVILLWLWQKSQIKVFQVGFLIIGVLVLISYTMDLIHTYSNVEYLPIIANKGFITGVVVIASCIINGWLLKKEGKDDVIEVNGIFYWSIKNVIKTLKFFMVLFAFLVPFFELNCQLMLITDIDGLASFRYATLATYTIFFIAILAFVYRKNTQAGNSVFWLFFISVLFYTSINNYLIIDLRFDIFNFGEYTASHFLIHFLGLFAVASIIYLLIKGKGALLADKIPVFCWLTVICSVVILSIETDNIVILLFGNKENYYSILYDVHTFGYPVLWGIIAAILMIWGLKQKEVLLRKISLVFFGVIIVKFYAYDVWRMSQAGRIVSFVLLGVILLVVSFLQQKIKTLVKDDVENEEISQ